MKLISKKIFNNFFNQKNDENYGSYKRAGLSFPIKEHLHFLAQIAHESVYLKYNQESHNYSIKRIKTVFPKYFRNKSNAFIKKYSYSPKLLDRVYANRMGNGNEASREGSKYRGRGYIQLTGKNNYILYGYVEKPYLLKKDFFENWCVCFKFWQKNKIDSFCDSNVYDLSFKEIKKITRKINGGLNGYNDRVKKSKQIKDLVEKYKKIEYLFKHL